MPNPFTKHPQEQGFGYFGHLSFALIFASFMIVGGFALVIHALFPFLFVRTGSDIVKKLYRIIKSTENDTRR